MNSNQLTHGAISALVYFILLFMFIYIPILTIFVLFLLPVPFVVHTYRFGSRSTLLVGLGCLLLTVAATHLFVIFTTIMAISVGCVMGYYYVKKENAFFPILSGMIVYLGNYLLFFFIMYVFLDVNIVEVLEQFSKDAVILSEDQSGFLQIPLNDDIYENYEVVVANIMDRIPGLMMLFALLMASAHHVISRPLLSKLGEQPQCLPPIKEWNLPKSLLYYYLVAIILVLLDVAEPGGAFYYMVVNMHMVLEFLLLIQGLTFIAHYADVKQWGRAPLIIGIICSFLPVFSMIIRIFGILDIGLGLKERTKKSDTRG